MKNSIVVVIAFLFNLCAFAQIEINHTLKPIGNDSLAIKNVGAPQDSTGLVNLRDIRQRTYLFFNATLTNDSTSVQIDTSFIQIKKGLMIYLKCDNSNIGSVNMSVNGQNYLITKNNQHQLDSGDILTDKILVLICNDTSFNLMNPERPPCPSGFSQVNENYCIQVNESAGNFWKASRACQSMRYRLCSWSEWYYACYHQSALGLSNMTNNWEWVNQGQNEENTGKQVGNTTCEITMHGSLAVSASYRCCFNF